LNASERSRSAGQGVAQSPTDSVVVATLTRISTDEVNQPYSLEAQAIGLDSFVASQPGHTITHRFVDQASGATLERPGLQAALAAARSGDFDVLLVYRIDRLTRSIVGLMSIVEELGKAGVALRSATEPIDTQGPVGRMLLQLLGIFAESSAACSSTASPKDSKGKPREANGSAAPAPTGTTSTPPPKRSSPTPMRLLSSKSSSTSTSASGSVRPRWPTERHRQTVPAGRSMDEPDRAATAPQPGLRRKDQPRRDGPRRQDEPILDDASFDAAQSSANAPRNRRHRHRQPPNIC
jgi:hypothetical protein